jgi:hypothetical protein
MAESTTAFRDAEKLSDHPLNKALELKQDALVFSFLNSSYYRLPSEYPSSEEEKKRIVKVIAADAGIKVDGINYVAEIVDPEHVGSLTKTGNSKYDSYVAIFKLKK